jgi:hypothetical protein
LAVDALERCDVGDSVLRLRRVQIRSPFIPP